MEALEWYVLHVHADREHKVAGILERKLPPELYRPFVPYKEMFFKRVGITKIEKKICFPGYVFVESKTTAEKFAENARIIIRGIKEIYAVLSHDGKNDYAISENERVLFSKLFREDDCLKVSYGVIINKRAKVTSGTLLGMDELIKKVDRHKKNAEIEINLFGEPRRLIAPLEIYLKT